MTEGLSQAKVLKLTSDIVQETFRGMLGTLEEAKRNEVSETELTKLINDFDELVKFVDELIHTEVYLFSLTPDDIKITWSEFRRRETQNILNFVLKVTTKLRLYYGLEWTNVINQLSMAYSLDRNSDSVIVDDEDFIQLKFDHETLKRYFTANPWLVALSLIHLIEPFYFDVGDEAKK